SMENATKEKAISVLLKQKRSFPPPSDFVKKAVISGPAARARLGAAAKRAPEKFWAAAASQLEWFKPWRKTLEWKAPHAKWFVGGKINLAHNCLDRHLD